MNTLTSLLRQAADYASSQPPLTSGPDMSRFESLLTACDSHNGDGAIACTILATTGPALDGEPTPESTLRFLRTATISDADISTTFGPAHDVVTRLIHQASNLTIGEAVALSAAFVADEMASARGRAWAKIDRVVWRSVRRTVRNAAEKPEGVDQQTWHNAREAMSDGICAAAGRDLVDQGVFSPQDYRTMTDPWRTVLGLTHLDDVAA